MYTDKLDYTIKILLPHIASYFAYKDKLQKCFSIRNICGMWKHYILYWWKYDSFDNPPIELPCRDYYGNPYDSLNSKHGPTITLWWQY